MTLLEVFLYVVAIFFVAAYLILLGVLLFQEKGRRTLVLALRSLWLHKMRSMLSVLGIIIGTTAVIALLSFGEGSMQDALEEIKRLGATNIVVESEKPPDDISTQSRTFVARYGITQDDYNLFQTIPNVTRMVPVRSFTKPVYHDQYMFSNARVVATTSEFKDIKKLREAAGRFMVDEDGETKENYCVLGSAVAEKLFPFSSPIDQSILIDKFSYVVVGVTAPSTPISGGDSKKRDEDFNNDVYIPLGTASGRFGQTVFLRQSGTRSGEQVEFSQVTLTVSDTDEVRPVGEAIKTILDRHPKKDTILSMPLEKLEQAEAAKNRFKSLLGMIAAISLIVGGIGIMNIMLATVTERTREIGTRRALGAKRRDITMQFLIEAIVQTTIGGLVGVFLGLLIIFVVPWAAMEFWDKKMPAKLHEMSIFLSLGAAVIVGVFAGLYPAYRAALLDPIEALRHE
jgi:putative ABC transport system permease protein